MTQIDQFESVFRSAVKDIFHYEDITFKSVMIITDKAEKEAAAFVENVKKLLNTIPKGDTFSWRIVHGHEFDSAEDIIDLVEKEKPDLVCTYRNLHSRAWSFKFSLGAHLDVLLQVSSMPVLLLPHPDASYAAKHAFDTTNCVMAVTDHISSDDRLVNNAVRFTAENGTLYLVHIENRMVFEKFIDVISKIPSINTDEARLNIESRLLKEPADYIKSCISIIKELGLPIMLEAVVDIGQHVEKYRELIDKYRVNMIVMNTKDNEQLAMHRVAYPLAIELREIPLLML
jgi:hypothetical protein